jgi:hypothetical protein
MPSSSALTSAKFTHFTTVNQGKSSLRVTGPSGSFEITSGRIDRLGRLGSFSRSACSADWSRVSTLHCPFSKAAKASAALGKPSPRRSSNWRGRSRRD